MNRLLFYLSILAFLTAIIALFCIGVADASDCSEFTLQKDGSLKCTANPHKTRDQVLANAFMAVGAVADCMQTVPKVQSGKVSEGNPLMTLFAKSYPRCFAIKAVGGTLIALHGWQTDSIRGQLVAGSLWGGVAIYSIVQF